MPEYIRHDKEFLVDDLFRNRHLCQNYSSMFNIHSYYVYIMTNNYNTVLYTGVTNEMERRVWEHKSGVNKNSFTSKYNCNKLIYFEEFADINEAIHREKQLKKYRREWKENLINSFNPEWKDLAEKWHEAGDAGMTQSRHPA